MSDTGNTGAFVVGAMVLLDQQKRKLRMMAEANQSMSTQEPLSRDELAARAMQAYLLNYAGSSYETVAEYAYKMADAMIAERAKAAG